MFSAPNAVSLSRPERVLGYPEIRIIKRKQSRANKARSVLKCFLE